jgi:hypothetical protein
MWPNVDKSSRATNTSRTHGGGLHVDEDALLTSQKQVVSDIGCPATVMARATYCLGAYQSRPIRRENVPDRWPPMYQQGGRIALSFPWKARFKALRPLAGRPQARSGGAGRATGWANSVSWIGAVFGESYGQKFAAEPAIAGIRVGARGTLHPRPLRCYQSGVSQRPKRPASDGESRAGDCRALSFNA